MRDSILVCNEASLRTGLSVFDSGPYWAVHTEAQSEVGERRTNDIRFASSA